MLRLGQRRQFFLFVAAILVPYAVLVVLSLRVVGQDRELREKRSIDERRRTLSQVRDELLARLEAIRRDEVLADLKPGDHYRHPAVALIGWLDDNRLVLPWETDYAARQSRERLVGSPFESKIRDCEHSEFGGAQMESAARCYAQAVSAAKNPVQEANARLLWARALNKAGHPAEAGALFEALLRTAPDLTDEDGVPIAIHAAQQLAQVKRAPGRVLDALNVVVMSRPWLAPVSCFLVSDIAEKLAAGSPVAVEVKHKVSALIRLAEQAESLQNDFPRLGLLPRGKPIRPGWVLYGDEMWLVRAADGGGSHTPVIAVRARAVFTPLEAERPVRFADLRDPQGEALGEPFAGVKLVLAQENDPALQHSYEQQRRLYYYALLLVAAATAFGGYLLWRDLRRDLRLSELQAQFVSSVSHELRTPLTAIRMLAETLQMGRVKEQQAQEEYLDTIVNECERLSRLVDDVLLFTKMEQGKKTYRFKPVPLEEIVGAAARALAYPLAQKGFRLRLNIEAGLPAVMADRDALQQAVLNLLSNAMKYSGDAREIELGLGRENGSALIHVTDRGLGIPAEEHSRIFEKFYRAPTTANQLIPGTGLGLALVAQIVKAHGGTVEVSSSPGKGSTFSIHLPLEKSV